MTRTVVIWALVLGVGAFLLQWLQYQYAVRVLAPEAYAATIGAVFLAGGVWLGARLFARTGGGFERNAAAVAALGLTGQEMRVLEKLAVGQSNKEIARSLGLSPNTVKTHVANLFAKLEVGRRTEAVHKARGLHLVP